ncbi:vomeronasal type-1 receptor 4-like [Manis javanica]|uniref:vomeronasal type-1 receptor 4-like n=1 Tax=Manis javanica TaxID=9974 RepID=UPI003C6D2F5F
MPLRVWPSKQCRLRSTYLIIKNLLVANSLVLFSCGVQCTVRSFGWFHALGDSGCRFSPYVRGVAEGVSTGTTCLLSVFQAVTMSPRNPGGQSLSQSSQDHRSFCFPGLDPGNADSVFTAPRSFPDIVCLGLMLGASSCTVSILHRHKPRVQHIRTANVALRSSPESRATRSILLLVSTLVCFYTLSAILQSFLSVTENPCWFLLDTNTVYFRFLAPPPGLGERNLVPWTNGKREVGGSSLVRTNETRVLSEERGQ